MAEAFEAFGGDVISSHLGNSHEESDLFRVLHWVLLVAPIWTISLCCQPWRTWRAAPTLDASP